MSSFRNLSKKEIAIISIVVGTFIALVLGYLFGETKYLIAKGLVVSNDVFIERGYSRYLNKYFNFNYIVAIASFIITTGITYLYLSKERVNNPNSLKIDKDLKSNNQILHDLSSKDVDEVVKSLVQIIKQYKERMLVTNPDKEDDIVVEFIDDIEYVNNQIISLAENISMNHKVNLAGNRILNLQSFLQEKITHKMETVYIYEDVYFDDIKNFIEEMIMYCYIKINA